MSWQFYMYQKVSPCGQIVHLAVLMFLWLLLLVGQRSNNLLVKQCNNGRCSMYVFIIYFFKKVYFINGQKVS